MGSEILNPFGFSLSHCLIVRLNGCLGAKDNGGLRGQHPTIAMRDRGRAIGDLARSAFMAQLSCRLDQQKQPIHAGVAIGEPTAIGVDRQAALWRDAPIGNKAAAFALWAEAE